MSMMKTTKFYMPLEARVIEIQNYIYQLAEVLHYPLHWYAFKTDKEIIGIRRKHIQKIVARAMMRNKEEVNRRLMNQSTADGSMKGYWEVIGVNKCSMRMIYHIDGVKKAHAIISTYTTKGFDLILDKSLDNEDDVWFIWETGRGMVMNKSALAEKMKESTGDNIDEIIDVMLSLKRRKK